MSINYEIYQLDVPQRFFEYAQAYQNAAYILCEKMVLEKSLCTWPDSSVVLYLSAHATELFIKGAILYRDPNAKIKGHNIDDLSAKYKSHYFEPCFEWDIPFGIEKNLDVRNCEITAIRKSTSPSIVYRYPYQLAKDCEEWKGIFAFEPRSFLKLLAQLKLDFERIKSQII